MDVAMMSIAGPDNTVTSLGPRDELTDAIARQQQRIRLLRVGDEQHRRLAETLRGSLAAKDQKLVGWQMFLWLFIEGKNGDQLQKAVQKAFPPEPKSLNPYVFKGVTDSYKALAHIYTTKFYRKTEYRLGKKTQVAKFPLTGVDLKELLSFLARYPVGTRLVLNRVDRSEKLLTSRIDSEEA